MADPRVVKSLFDAASNTPGAGYENLLDGLRKIIQGNASPATSLDNTDATQLSASRKSLYDNFKALADSDGFKALIGKATITLADGALSSKAKTDFAAFLSLNALSPFVISTTDTTAIAKLKQANETLAQQWEADAQLTPAQRNQGLANFSNNWYTDRTAMLGALNTRNQQNIADGSFIPGTANTIYQDFATGQTLTVSGGVSPTVYSPRIIFGADGIDTLTGLAGSDHLYGGAEADTLTGNAGDDYLEGGAGNDTYQFTGAFGKDTITDSDGSGGLTFSGSNLTGGKFEGVARAWCKRSMATPSCTSSSTPANRALASS